MYVPPIYRSSDPRWPGFVVRGYPLATFVTNGSPLPHATHLPAVLTDPGTVEGDLSGATLLCHMNRANPHWRSLSDGDKGRLIFTGPSAYVSPVTYREEPSAPTWDFVAVHLEGDLEVIADFEQTLDVVRLTAERLEDAFGDGWDLHPSLDHFRRIGPGVGAFRFQTTNVESMIKLSQEKSSEIQDRIIARFEASASGGARDLGRLMKDFGLGSAEGLDPERCS